MASVFNKASSEPCRHQGEQRRHADQPPNTGQATPTLIMEASTEREHPVIPGIMFGERKLKRSKGWLTDWVANHKGEVLQKGLLVDLDLIPKAISIKLIRQGSSKVKTVLE